MSRTARERQLHALDQVAQDQVHQATPRRHGDLPTNNAAAPGFPARVSAEPVRDGINWRWFYTIVEQRKTGVGYGTWEDRAGGRAGTAYNMLEDANGSTGRLGNGVDLADLDAVNDGGGTFEPQPIPAGTRVWVMVVAGEYWIIGGVGTAPSGRCG